jgi:hypothetical protein
LGVPYHAAIWCDTKSHVVGLVESTAGGQHVAGKPVAKHVRVDLPV